MFTKNRILLGLLFLLIIVVLIYYVWNQSLHKEGFTDEENAEISQAKFYTSSQNKLPTSLLNMVKQGDFNNSSIKDIASTLDSSINYLNSIPQIAFELTSTKTQMPSYSSSLDKTMNILYTNKLPNIANIYIPTPLPSHRDSATVSAINRIPVPIYELNNPDYNDYILTDYEVGVSNKIVTNANSTANNVTTVNTPTTVTNVMPIVSGIVSLPMPTNINVDGNNYSQYLSYNYGNVYSVNRQTGDMYSPVNNNYTITGNVSSSSNVVGNAYDSLQAYNDYTDYDVENVITPYMGCINSGKTEAQCSVFTTSY